MARSVAGRHGRDETESWSWKLNGAGAHSLPAGADGLAPGPVPGGNRPRRGRWARGRVQASWPLVAALGATAALAAMSVHPHAYDAPTLRASVETIVTLLALTGAWLLRAQFEHTRRMRDLLLLQALLTLAALELCLYALPTVMHLQGESQIGAARLLGSLFVAAAFAAAAFAPADRFVLRGDRPHVVVAAITLTAVTAAEVGALLLRGQLVGSGPDPVSGLGAGRHPLASVLVIAATGLFAYAATAFVAQSREEATGVASLLAGALILLASARSYYLALPLLSRDWIAPSDGLRLLAVGFILTAAVRRELQMRIEIGRAAAVAERRKVARDLHDGLAQDLAFIAAHSQQMAQEMGAEHPVTVAARRALEISRGTIAELSEGAGTTLDALEAVAEELGNRFEIAIVLDVSPEIELAPEARDHVARIAREAIANAARHGRARDVVVSLRRAGTAAVLRVRDDGCGIGTGGPESHEDFGLRSIRERAASLDGRLTVRELKRGGTELEVMFP